MNTVKLASITVIFDVFDEDGNFAGIINKTFTEKELVEMIAGESDGIKD